MIEFDHHAYHRKWDSCYGVFSFGDNSRFTDRLYGIEGWNTDNKVITFGTLQNRKTRVFLEEGDKEGTYPIIKLHYHEFPSGVYPRLINPGFAVIDRRHHRAFFVGLRPGVTHQISWVGNKEENLFDIDLLGNVEQRPIEDKPFGWINRRVWWEGDKLYYLRHLIGYISNPNSIKITDSIYVPFLKQLVGEGCQIKTL